MGFYNYPYYFAEAKEVDIIVADFIIDVCSKPRLPPILSEYVQLFELPAYVTG